MPYNVRILISQPSLAPRLQISGRRVQEFPDNILSNFLDSIELVLIERAQVFAPDGTEPRAVVHQWAHAIANEAALFCGIDDRNPKRTDRALRVSKKELINDLKVSGLYKNAKDFREKMESTIHLKPEQKQSFTFIDLFAGVGGMRLGFQANGGRCVFSSEFDKNSQATYFENHGDFPFGDITQISPKDIPDHDVLLAGFPCQPFSHAGLKLGIDDTRGTLFHDIAGILENKRPKFALLENVKGLISHDKGYTLQVILRTLTRIGYRCNISTRLIQEGSAKEIQTEAKKMVLKSVDFGVPQNRQRIYIVLWREGVTDRFEYPLPTGLPTRVGDALEKTKAVSENFTISDRLWAGHQRRKIDNKKNGKGFGFGLVTPDSPYTNTISARYYKDGSEILIGQENGKNPRKLSPREAGNIQGFPPEFILNKSKVQCYRQFGNSVSVPVISALAKNLTEKLT